MNFKTKIERNCVVCGKKMIIEVADNGKYDKGHYLGTMKMPQSIIHTVWQKHLAGKSVEQGIID